MASEGKEYRLQGCFALGTSEPVSRILGENYRIPNDDAVDTSDNMSLSLCLRLCASMGTASNGTYPYVGVSNGESCYCGTTINSLAQEIDAKHCTVPCKGNSSEACGGTSSMSIYMLADHTNTRASHQHTGDYPDNSPFSRDADADGQAGLGVTAGIVVGSVAVCGLILLCVFLGVRRHKRRKKGQATGRTYQRQDAVVTSSSTPRDPEVPITRSSETIATLDEKAVIQDARRVSLRKLDSVVMDTLPPRPSDASNSIPRLHTVCMAATTGADWPARSPITPRGTRPATPRSISPAHTDGAWEDIPTTPSLLVQHPRNVATTQGLGERAWHRRRLSVSFPPEGYGALEQDDGRSGASGRKDEDEDEDNGDGSRMASLMPKPLDLRAHPDGFDVSDVSAVTDDDGKSTWRWTVSTMDSGISDWRPGKKEE